ncbi:unnamed protein product, partial [marine sediment metagenome]
MSRRTLGFVLLFLLVSGVLVAHCAHYWPFLSDDALISLRYARRLNEGLGLTWTGNERVEGYTDLLWVLLTALPGRLGLDLIWTARVLDFIGALLAILMVSLSPESLQPSRTRLLTGGLALALSAPVAVWAIGGLEHGFMLGVLAAALLFLNRALQDDKPATRNWLLVGLLLAILSLLRADGPVLALGVGLGVILSGSISGFRQTARRVGLLAALPCCFVAAQLVFRLLYYGEWIPNSAL